MKKYDFSGYATRNDLRCSDGRTITKDAFKDNNGQTVPLVWQHIHTDPGNVLGHALLENREDGVYAYCKFNETEAAKNAKALVQHGDITALSIYANQLVQKGAAVLHGAIREVSLVLTGANPGALIDNLSFSHGDGSSYDDDTEAIIYTGETITMGGELKHAAEEKTVEDVFNTLNDEQKEVVYFMIGAALEQEEDDDDDDDDDDMNHSGIDYLGGSGMKRNVFEKYEQEQGPTLTHSQMQEIFEDAQKCGSLKESFLAHAQTYGIEAIDILFPDAKTVTPTPEVIGRRTEWVNSVISGTTHTPFSRIKSTAVDITADEARAKGYVKGNLKKEEIIKLLKRVTTPTTIYKKQKLDRDDIIDITDLDVVAWLKAEMRLMLDEELARAILIGDGREPDDEDKINEDNLRPIAYDNDMYAHKVTIPANVTGEAIIESILRARPKYKGTGTPALYTTEAILTDLLLLKDKMGRRLYNTEAELASALRVSKIITVEVMETVTDLIGIMVNISDYKLGADKGGQISMFDDFDIDYNQYKYLIETRVSGALTKPKSAIVISREAGTLATPTVPTFVPSTGVLTVPSVTGVEYYVDDVKATAGAQTAIDGGVTIEVVAKPATGYYFPHNFDADWSFTSTKA